jgi:hypothetical protein
MGARSRRPHHSATAKQYCPSSSTVARQQIRFRGLRFAQIVSTAQSGTQRVLPFARPAQSLLCAALHKIPSLRTCDLLVDRLFEAVKTSLRHAKLHLVSLLLALQSL